MNNVQLIMTRYNIDSLSPGRKVSISEVEKKKRKVFLEKIAICLKNTDIRERTLSKILSWLEEWSKCLEVSSGKDKVKERMGKLNQGGTGCEDPAVRGETNLRCLNLGYIFITY